MGNEYFKLFANCVPVRGAKRSVIYDLQKEDYSFIPNVLYEILIKYKDYTIKEIKKRYNNEYDNIIDEYFNFLTKKNMVFYVRKMS